MRIKRTIAATALAVGVATAGLSTSGTAAQLECTVSNFTVGGVFDQEGYLACLAGQGGTTVGGELPSTGQESLQTVGLAAGIFLVGGALVVSSQRRKALPA
jgi:LPXTG-motif cell wall-anchored protein